MTDVPCFRARWALMALTALHLWPPHAVPVCPGALFKLSSGLWALVWSKLLSCLFAALLWLSWLWLPHCGPACSLFSLLGLGLIAMGRAAPGPGSCHQSWPWCDSSTRPCHQGLPWCGCLAEVVLPGPALLLLGQLKGSAWWAHSPGFPVEQPAQLFQTHGSWASLHLALLLQFFFLHSGEIERVIS